MESETFEQTDHCGPSANETPGYATSQELEDVLKTYLVFAQLLRHVQ
jgi:hypothetical protein